MFDVGFSELVVIGLVALLVLGPKRLPEVARTAGRWMGQFRRFVDGVKQDFQQEINSAEFSEVRKIHDDLTRVREIVETEADGAVTAVNAIAAPTEAPFLEAPAPPDKSAPAAKPRPPRKPARKPAVKKTAATQKSNGDTDRKP